MRSILILLLLKFTNSQLERKISVLIDGGNEKEEFKFKTIIENVFDEAASFNSAVHLKAEFIKWDLNGDWNQLQITNNLICPYLLNNSVAVFLIQTENLQSKIIQNLYSATAYSLGFYKVPVLGIVRSAELSKKNLYPTFLRILPSADEATVFINLLSKLKYRQVVLMTVENQDGQEFVTLFQQLAKDIHVQKHIELAANQLSTINIDGALADTTSNTIILYANQNHAEQIFTRLESSSQIGRVWILNEAGSFARNVPEGFLGVRMRQDLLVTVGDALKVLIGGSQILAQFNEGVMPPLQCKKMARTANEWTNNVGMQFFNKLVNTTINRDALYEVINFQQILPKPEVVGFMNQHTILTLDEDGIVWPGGIRIKPLEITLPKHLHCLTVPDDPPFTFSFAVANASQCKDYTKIRMNYMNVQGPWYPCFKREKSNEISAFCCAGYAVDLLSELSKAKVHDRLQAFTFDLFLNESYGAIILDPNGGYQLSGMLGELDSNRADLAIGAISVNPERKRYVDLSIPWLYHGIQILEKWRPKESPLESFTQPFKKSLWFALFGSVIFIGIIIYLLDLKSPFEQFEINDADSLVANNRNLTNETQLTFGESFWFAWGILLNSGVSEKTPKSFSGRLLGIAWCGFCLIFVASFTANLSAFLVLYDEQDKNAANGINDPRFRNPSANFSFATVQHSNTYQYFKRHIELSTMFRKMENNNFRNSREAIQALLNDTLGAFIWDSVRLDFEASRNCDLRTRGPLFGRSSYTVALQKNSPWTEHISKVILRLSEDGTLASLNDKWIMSSGFKKCNRQIRKTPARLGLHNMYEIFVFLAIGIIVGALMSVVEVWFGRRREQKIKKKQLAQNYALKWRSHLNPGPTTSSSSNKSRSHSSSKSKFLCCFSSKNESNELKRRNSEPNSNLRNEGFAGLRRNRSEKDTVFVPELNFGPRPSHVYCSKCRVAIRTVTRPVVGLFAIICSTACVLLMLWPCALAPCFLQIFADYEHRCPVCGHIVGRFRRGRAPKFYV